MPHAQHRALALFRATFGHDPHSLARAPGRVNIIGEHIDYNGGCVLPMAIDRECAVTTEMSTDGVWRVMAELEPGAAFEFTSTDLLRAARGTHPPSIAPGDWRSYVLGVLACLCREREWTDGPPPALQIAIASDVPVGAGLSSSAALEVSVVRAACAAWGIALSDDALAALCRRAEHEFAGVPCGIMDQMACAGARPGHAMLIDCREPVRLRHVAMPREARFVIINTGVRHALGGAGVEAGGGEYAARARATAGAARKLGVRWLCGLIEAELVGRRGTLTDEEWRLARHCVTEHARVQRAVDALEQGDLEEVGRAMWLSHASLRDDYRVSCPELDAAVEACRGAGALGARMTGGGFGGCAIALVRDDSGVARVRHACAGFPQVFEAQQRE